MDSSQQTIRPNLAQKPNLYTLKGVLVPVQQHSPFHVAISMDCFPTLSVPKYHAPRVTNPVVFCFTSPHCPPAFGTHFRPSHHILCVGLHFPRRVPFGLINRVASFYFGKQAVQPYFTRVMFSTLSYPVYFGALPYRLRFRVPGPRLIHGIPCR